MVNQQLLFINKDITAFCAFTPQKLQCLTDYVDEIYKTLVNTPRKRLNDLKELDLQTPQPMCTTYEKQPPDEAIAVYKQRQQMQTAIVPPTCTGMIS